MKHCVLVALTLSGSIFAPVPTLYAAPATYSPLAVTETAPTWKDLEVNDAKRARVIPIRVYLPAQTAATSVVFFSHGPGGRARPRLIWVIIGRRTVMLRYFCNTRAAMRAYGKISRRASAWRI